MLDTAIIYQLNDGRLYDVELAKFVTEADPEKNLIKLYASGKPAGEDYLKRTLAFYGWTIGSELKTLDEAKAEKLTALAADFDKALKTLSVTSSLGVTVNADTDALVNVEALIKAGTSPVSFMCYDNTTAELTSEQLATLESEMFAARQALYENKWAIREAINSAESVEVAEAISWDM